jgi:hypothetical protein
LQGLITFNQGNLFLNRTAPPWDHYGLQTDPNQVPFAGLAEGEAAGAAAFFL